MTDNITLNAGVGGSTLATDQMLTGAHVQRVELVTVTADALNDVNTSNPLPVSDAGGNISIDDGGNVITVDGVVTANLAPVTSGGLTVKTTVSTAAVLLANIKPSGGQLYGYSAFSIDSVPVYIKFHDKATTPATGETVKFKVAIPAAATAANGSFIAESFPNGIPFTDGIGIEVTKTFVDASAAALEADEVIITLYYK
jgi:hypothetical protein